MRDPELEKLLRSTDALIGGTQADSSETVDAEKPKSESGSSFMKSVVGLFIVQDEEKKDENTTYEIVEPPPTPHTVEEIASTIPTPTFSVSSDDMSTKDFNSIYLEAGIDESEFTVDKLNTLLQDPSLKDQPISTKTLVLKMALKAQNIEPTVPVTDAVRRDKALDAYQQMLNQRAKQIEEKNLQAVQQINDEVKRFLEQKNAEMDALRTEIAETKRQTENFATRRLQEEQRLAEIVMPLLEGQPNPVSVGNDVD